MEVVPDVNIIYIILQQQWIQARAICVFFILTPAAHWRAR